MIDIGFLSYNAQSVLFSTFLLGVAAGIIGCFAYWKRQSLMSDALSHAALPGVVLGFMMVGEKNLLLMILGASITALLGALFIHWIRSYSRVKEDAAMGIVLSVFFGLGMMLVTLANRMPGGNQSGLDSFIFGQAASMVSKDVWTMLIVAILIIAISLLTFKEWKLFLFDPSFAKGLGFSTKIMNSIYLIMLVTVIVIGIQAVGVILMAALLIIPSVSARYWTESFKVMVILSASFGGGAGLIGTFISTWGNGWPTGPFIVITASSFFLLSLFFGVKKGLVPLYIQQYLQRKNSEKTPFAEIVGKGGE
ncbi:metal ABC transporter permease [Bacillus sp. B1-b2]|uniref:metal ABC transporter permease n=1 Tax=Bacillus sp. B1-b2 TaxID=2653201 RepID=UPI0012625FE1|nr:iron chelate uptake ABC transporter family permease subunit [Bacillus sp. B1-b2]KAB7671888.1 metal ABC transporter permease [Bacillus sp. B1-b2]